MSALTILTRLSDAIEATGAGLLPASYRMPIELQPVAGTHRRFQVRLTGSRIARPYWGSGIAFVGLDVAVRVSYMRPGGDTGGGDRKSINIQAGGDGVLIQDALEDVRNWDRPTTDIREVKLRLGAAHIVDDRLRVVYATTFSVEAEFPWPT